MSKKFDNIPTESDTKVLLRDEHTFGDLDCIYEFWVWDGIKAESLIFVDSEVPNKDKLLKEIKSTKDLVSEDSEVTTKVSKGFFFVNFNFVAGA